MASKVKCHIHGKSHGWLVRLIVQYGSGDLFKNVTEIIFIDFCVSEDSLTADSVMYFGVRSQCVIQRIMC